MNNKTSLIKKIVSHKTVLTPFEAIHLKYLARKGLLNELANVERQTNPYIAAEKAFGIISPYYVNFIIGHTAQNSPDLFKSYNYAYEYIFEQDSNSEKLGYKGLMLLTQLQLMKCKHGNLIKTGKLVAITDYLSYSYFHQKVVSFANTLSTLGTTFKYFLKGIDNILILNYYLKKLIDLEDLSCLKIFNMWLNKPDQCNSDDFEYLNGAYLCCRRENIQKVINNNHSEFTESLSASIQDLPNDFTESSLEYVQKVLAKIISKHKKTF